MENIDTIELIGQIIDIFEDYLEDKKNITKETDADVLIKGKDYDKLASAIKDTLVSWELIERE